MSHLLRFFLVLLQWLRRTGQLGVAIARRWLVALLRRLGGGTSKAPAATERAPDSAPAHPVVRGPTFPVPEDAPHGRFLDGAFKHAAGQLDYKLFLPVGASDGLRPLVVMLHGCKQNPDDFAIGTRMNELAQAQACLVLYPAQSRAANGFFCWNWFQPRHQQREGGEPALLAGMIRDVTARYAVDPQRVYVAGLSAGASMAITLAHTHPELLAAVGAHSGLPHGAARSMIGALVVMKRGAVPEQASSHRPSLRVPLIVFQGDEDSTVHPRNGLALMAQAGFQSPPSKSTSGGDNRAFSVAVRRGSAGGRAYSCTGYHDPERGARAEHWLVHGAGHAWSGGNSQGSYADPLGPDASAEFLRFFLTHGNVSL